MNKILTLTLTLIFTCIFITSCSGKTEEATPAASPASDVATPEIEVVNDSISVSSEDEGSSVGEPEEASDVETETASDDDSEAVSGDSEPKAEALQTQNEASSNKKPIVWLGDSLTQGSLGDNNDNLANAPYEKLKKMVNVPVEGYGMYAFNTHDVIWTYTDEEHYNQIADPNKTYIFWLGSNDWVTDEGVNSNTEPVIKEIDRFLNLEDGGIRDYIVIGTTSRISLGDLYIPINNDLKAHYKEHYMDVMDIINKYGYSSDNTHLSQESYDAIAAAVYEKLKNLGYI